MKKPLTLNSFLGNTHVVEVLRRAVRKDRLPHALIFSGPPGIGKCTLGVLLAQYLNCRSPEGESGCGYCSNCVRIAAVIETRYLECLTLKAGSYCGACTNCKERTRRHPDIRIIEPEWDEKKKKKNTTISIEQVRRLISEISYEPFEARYRVVMLDPADQMTPGAHNSLLKTLEEPPSRTIMILVTTNPHVLLDTIRSRSRRLQFGGIPQQLIEEYLLREDGRSSEEARLAAIFSEGSLGTALAFNTAEYKEIRARALRFVELLLTRGSFAAASALAAVAAKEKEEFQMWLESVGIILQDIYYAQTAPERIGQLDLLDELGRLARTARHSAVVEAIDWLRDLNTALLHNVNRQIALEAMFLGVTEGHKSPYGIHR